MEAAARRQALQVAWLTVETVEAKAARLQELLVSLSGTFVETCRVAAPKPCSHRAPCHSQEYKTCKQSTRCSSKHR